MAFGKQKTICRSIVSEKQPNRFICTRIRKYLTVPKLQQLKETLLYIKKENKQNPKSQYVQKKVENF